MDDFELLIFLILLHHYIWYWYQTKGFVHVRQVLYVLCYHPLLN